MLIGELAELAGTTVRAIRHYHSEGQLRRTDPRLAGLPPVRLSGSLTEHLDAFEEELAEQERQIPLQRKRIAELRSSTVELPPRVRALYAHLEANGINPEPAVLDGHEVRHVRFFADDPEKAVQLLRSEASSRSA